MPENYKALQEFYKYAFDMLRRFNDVDYEAMKEFEEDFADAKKEFPTLFGPDEVAGTNIRAPHFKAYTTAERMKNFMALELGVNLEEYEKAIKAQTESST